MIFTTLFHILLISHGYLVYSFQPQFYSLSSAYKHETINRRLLDCFHSLKAISQYLENDLVSVELPNESARLFVVRPDATISPLCTHEDDNPMDVYIDPRITDRIEIEDDDVIKCYGEGYYSQRVVPSLGGGLGYGAEADDVWSLEEEMMDELIADKVELPCLDLGIAHGEKSRGGAI